MKGAYNSEKYPGPNQVQYGQINVSKGLKSGIMVGRFDPWWQTLTLSIVKWSCQFDLYQAGIDAYISEKYHGPCTVFIHEQFPPFPSMETIH